MSLSDLTCSQLTDLVRLGCSMHMLTSIDGKKILWANEAFCHWIGYSLSQLQLKTWTQISLIEDSLDADLEAAKSLDRSNRSYSLVKCFIPNGGAPVKGHFQILRVLDGDGAPVDLFWCTWSPLAGSPSPALLLALESLKAFGGEFERMAAEVKNITQQTPEETALRSVVKVAVKYPKVTLGIMLWLVGTTGVQSVIDLARQVGWLDPQKAELVLPKDASYVPRLETGMIVQGLGISNQVEEQDPGTIGVMATDKTEAITATTPGGRVLEWERRHGRR